MRLRTKRWIFFKFKYSVFLKIEKIQLHVRQQHSFTFFAQNKQKQKKTVIKIAQAWSSVFRRRWLGFEINKRGERDGEMMGLLRIT